MGHPFSEKDIEVCGLNLRIKLWGHPPNPPILALHGWQDNAASFDSLGVEMSGYQIAAMDLPGHAFSDARPWGCTYHFVDWFGYIKGVLQKLNWSQCHLLGHSLGANIAAFYAAFFPKEVKKLVLIEGIGPLSSTYQEIPQRLIKNIEMRTFLSQKPKKIYASIDQAIDARCSNADISREAATLLASRGVRESENGFYWHNDPQLKLLSPHRFTENQVQFILKMIQSQTLILQAQGPSILAPEILNQRADCIAHKTIKSFEGNHHFHLDSASTVAKEINNFLKN